MAPFNKKIILNKTFLTRNTDQSAHIIVKIIKNNTSATTPLATAFLLIPTVLANTIPSNSGVMPTQQQRHQLPSQTTSVPARVPALREDIFPRAVKLFLINYFFKPEYKHLDKDDLLKIAETTRINVTLDDVRFIEKITHDQSGWYMQKLRAGRVMCSKLKSICETSLCHPDIDLLTEICYPEKCVNVAAASNDKDDRGAMLQFIFQMKKIHTNFNCKKIGLIVDRNFPFLAGLPDGLCSCACCGKYLVKIVCPFGCEKNVSLKNLLEMKDPFIVVMNGAHCLRQDHAYFYQLQMQMALARKTFAYFYVWSTGFRITNKILFDPTFWKENRARAMKFAKEVLSVELMCSYYTNIY